MNEQKKAIIVIVIALASILAISALGGLIFMLAWNWIMPHLFELPTLTYWQGFGLVFIVYFLFKLLIPSK